MRFLHRSGVCALALVAGTAALQFEPAAIRDLVFDNGSQRITVGAVRVPLWSTALAQSADRFSLENVSFTFGGATYELKRIDLSGVTLSQAEIEALFSAGTNEPLATRLARLNAKQVAAPEIKVTQKVGEQTTSITYKNVVLSDISQGRIASTTVEATGMNQEGPQANALISFGRISISDFDLPAFVRLYEAKATSSSEQLSRIYGAFTIESTDITDNKEGVSFKIARMNGRDFMARPTADSWTGTSALMTELANKDDLSEEDQKKLTSSIADLLGAFDIGFVEATDLDVKAGNNRKGPAAPVNMRINRMAYTSGVASGTSDMRLEGFETSSDDGRAKFDTLSLTGFSFRSTLEGLKSLQGKSFDEIDADTLRSLTPTLGTLRFEGFDIDATDTGDDGRKVPIKAALKSFELTADKPVNAIPTNIRISAQNFTTSLPTDSTDEGVKQLLDLGYKAIDMSFTLAATWNEAASEIALKEVSIQGQDMGHLSLTGLLGNISKDLFSADEAAATTTLIGAKAKSADLVIEDEGLLDRYLAKTAKEQKTKPETLRQLYAGAAPFVLSSMIGNSDQAKALSKAIASFIAKPGKLTVHATPKNSSGFGFMDVMLASEPQKIIEKLNISAKAE